jgi:hypothetical protein
MTLMIADIIKLLAAGTSNLRQSASSVDSSKR